MAEVHVVTGAFGFSGKYIAERLLKAGHTVRTLTNSPDRENPFEGRVKAYSYNFNNPGKLAESLRGATVLYNNYWVRFNYRKLLGQVQLPELHVRRGCGEQSEAVPGSTGRGRQAHRSREHHQSLVRLPF